MLEVSDEKVLGAPFSGRVLFSSLAMYSSGVIAGQAQEFEEQDTLGRLSKFSLFVSLAFWVR